MTFQSPDGTTTTDVLAAFDAWATSQGYERAQVTTSNQCTRETVWMAWAKPSNAVVLSYFTNGRSSNILLIPYGYRGIVRGSEPAPSVALPLCP